MARSVARPPSVSKSCTLGGGCAVVGASTTSAMLKIHPMRRCEAASRARALRSVFCDSNQPVRMLALVRLSSTTSVPRRSAQSINPDVDRDRKLHDIARL